MNSIWKETVKLPSFDKLEGNVNTEVLIIGGGIAGIMCAYLLKQQGISTIILEADTVCNKVTSNTTAKITSQHGFIYQKLLKQVGEKKARLYYDANNEAINTYRNLCKDIDCDFEDKDSYVYSVGCSKTVSAELDALYKLGIEAEYVIDLPLPFKISGAVVFKNQAQFNPLKFLSAILGELNVYEHTRVIKIDKNRAITDCGTVTAKKIIVTTHFPFINLHGSYFLKMYQHRSYVMAVKNAPQLNGMYVDENDKGMSFRNYGEWLFVGGGGHRTGKDGGGYLEIEEFIKNNYPSAQIDYRWATQDCMTLDRIPYIGKYSALTDNLYVATGFNKWGMTTSLVAAEILRDMIIGKSNRYVELFTPSRCIIKPQLAVNVFESISGLLYPSAKRCPHLGCVLKWNKQEHTWDCPCHGSRFTKDGILLDNPATDNLNK